MSPTQEIAEKYFLRSIEQEEMNPRSQNRVAELHFVQGRYEEASRVLSFIIRYWPVNYQGYLRLADCYVRLSQPEKA
jgi:tetratricopeptide (TPR) repeat protein